jgi:peroxiredoxin
VSKAGATRRERGEPPLTGKAAAEREARRERIVWLATGPPLLVIACVVAVLLVRNSAPEPPSPAADVAAADRKAPPELVKAADEVGFHPKTAPGIGRVEDDPASAAPSRANPDLLPVGARAPGFTLSTPTGETVRLADYRGKAVLLEFFATWCPHCAVEAPHLARLDRRLPDDRYAFLSINADGEDPASVFAYHRYFGLRFPALLDPSARPGSFHEPGAAGPATRRYRVLAFPTFYVVAPDGRVRWASDGEQPDALLLQELRGAARGR